VGRLATPALLPPLLRRIDNASYGGEDVSLAYLLKEETGAAVINCGSFYQHEPLKYRRMRAKGERWARWPLSRSPVSFHKFKDPDQLRSFVACALYDAAGRPRPSPRSLFPPNGSSSYAACADPWTAGGASAGARGAGGAVSRLRGRRGVVRRA